MIRLKLAPMGLDPAIHPFRKKMDARGRIDPECDAQRPVPDELQDGVRRLRVTRKQVHRLSEHRSRGAVRPGVDCARNVETLLPESPEMGRPGRVPGTRELVIPRTPCIVPYRLVGNTIQVLRIFHGARRWPETF